MNLRPFNLGDCAFTYNYIQHLSMEITAANLIHKHHFPVQTRIWEQRQVSKLICGQKQANKKPKDINAIFKDRLKMWIQ